MFGRSVMFGSVLGGAALVLSLATPAQAGTYSVTVYEASAGSAFNASLASIALLQAKADVSQATFTYTGPLQFANTSPQNSANTGDITANFFGANKSGITKYAGAGPATVAYGADGANFQTRAGFLATSGSVSGYGYGSLYTFTSDTGAFGGTNLTITHDDGASVYANAALVPGTTAGPTSVITETVTLPSGTTTYEIVYGRENGAPSILNVAVPEPMSVALLGAGLAGIALMARRKTTGCA